MSFNGGALSPRAENDDSILFTRRTGTRPRGVRLAHLALCDDFGSGVGPLQSLVFLSDLTAKATFLALRVTILHQKTGR